YERKNRNSMAVGQTQMLRDGSCRIDVNRPAEVVVIVSDDCQGSSVDSNEAGDRARCEVPTDLNERAFIGDRVYGVADGERSQSVGRHDRPRSLVCHRALDRSRGRLITSSGEYPDPPLRKPDAYGLVRSRPIDDAIGGVVRDR